MIDIGRFAAWDVPGRRWAFLRFCAALPLALGTSASASLTGRRGRFARPARGRA